MGEFPVVTVTEGQLRGRRVATLSGKKYYKFQGIPYAKPPIGPLRFQPPQPAEPWDGIRDALREGAVCMYYDKKKGICIGDEDCLFLNVYTPRLPTAQSHSLRPVMVFIHGGGFTEGSGNSDRYGPDFLVDEGVLVVTLNYRLGPFGFLSLHNRLVPGNMGLKDQVLALRWVQQNIATFCGNPEEVTLFGESAGAVCVHCHTVSPMSAGLFHRAIIQSGVVLNWWGISRNPVSRAFRLGQAMGCRATNKKTLFEFLSKADPREILKAVEPSKSEEEKRRRVWYIFIPCVEPTLDGEEAFLPKDPEIILKEGNFHHVPLIIGITSHEGIVVIKDVISDSSILQSLDRDFDWIVPDTIQTAKNNPEKYFRLIDRIKHFYFGCSRICEDTLENYVDLNSDLHFTLGLHRTLKLYSLVAPDLPVYVYQFCFDGGLNFLKSRVLQSKYCLKGACHADEIGYIFRQRTVNQNFLPESPEMITRRRVVRMWTNFAITGNPTPSTDKDIHVIWDPYTLSCPFHLKIDTELSKGGILEKDRMEFWEEAHRDVPCSFTKSPTPSKISPTPSN
ncbi:esterase E4 [Anabrus simplex]|uniref:esterase E4 n=1 Tax=Anabrus simplex TaxID=316456 RepID=UPI0035A2A2DF